MKTIRKSFLMFSLLFIALQTQVMSQPQADDPIFPIPVFNESEFLPETNQVRFWYGYTFDGDDVMGISVSGANGFSPAPSYRGQPSIFHPGEHTHVFSTDVSSLSPKPPEWYLVGEYAYGIPPKGVPFPGGSGTESSPYHIDTIDNLHAIRYAPNYHFVLTSDIDASETADWNDGDGFIPVGTSGTPFIGSLDGDGYTITGLTINRSSQNDIGIFGVTGEESEIKNLALEEFEINGDTRVGGLAGTNNGAISQVYITGNVNGSSFTGGLVGSHSGEIRNAYSVAEVSGDFSGGLAGVVNSSGTILTSYAAGAVSGGNFTGGLVGLNSGTITDSYWNTETSNQAGSDGGSGLSSVEMLDPANFSGWNFDTVWDIVAGGSYPFHQWQGGPEVHNLPSLQPHSLIKEEGDGSVTLTWNAIGDASLAGYNVYQNDSLVNTGGLVTDTTYTVTGLADYTTYTYYVTAVYEIGEDTFASAPSNEVEVYLTELSSSLWLDGEGDHVEVPDDITLDLTNTFTIEAWVKPESLGSNIQRIVAKSGAYGFGFSESILRFTTYGKQDYNLEYEALSENEWVHLACVLDGSNDAHFYVNGNLVGSLEGSSAASTSANPLFLGGNATNSEPLHGHLDELRIWNTSRSKEEIRQTIFMSLTGDETGLTGYWNFDDDTATIATDSSPSGNNGIISGAVHHPDTHPYGTLSLTGNEGWRMLSTPAEVNLADFLDPIWTQGATGADISHGNPNVFVWNIEGDEWAAVTDLTTTEVSAGTGILVYVFDKDDHEDEESNIWPKTLTVNGAENEADASPDVNQDENGFTLLGNPFTVPISFSELTINDLTGTIYVWDANVGSGDGGGDTGPNDPGAGSWKTWSGSAGDITDGLIAPFQGFFVQSEDGSPSVTFPESAKTTGGEFLGKQNEEERMIVRLEMSGENMRNSAWLSFSDSGSLEGQVRGDALQLEPLSSNFAKLATQKDDGTLFDISHLPVMEEYSVPVHISASENGSYTLTATDLELPDGFELYFHDYTAGKSVQIDQNFEYTVEVASAAKVNEQLSSMEKVKQGPVVAKATEKAIYSISVVNTDGINTGEPGTSPERVALNQNYPNPFNPVTVIGYELPVNSDVKLEVFDMLGRRVATLVNDQIEAGTHEVTFDASNLASGVYIYRLQTQGMMLTRKLTLIK